MKDIRTPVIKGKALEVLTWAGIAIVVIVVAIVIAKIFKAFKNGAEVAGDVAGSKIIETQTGISSDRQTTCRAVAVAVENAITRIPLVGTKIWVTDDDVVNALNRLLSAKEALLTSEFFKNISGDSLKGVVEGGFMVEASRAKIKDIVRNNLT